MFSWNFVIDKRNRALYQAISFGAGDWKWRHDVLHEMSGKSLQYVGTEIREMYAR